jgi:membrane protease YdiL (CAAX protease family)
MVKGSGNPKRVMLLGIILCFTLFFTCTLINSSVMLKLFGIEKANFESLLLSRIVQWLCLLLVFLYAIKIERQDFLLWKNKKYKIPAFVLHIVLLYIAVVVVIIPVRILINLLGLHQASPRLETLKSILLSYPLMIPFVCMTAGIVEEYVFRGYLQPRLETVTKSPFAAILVSAICFGAVHYAYGTIDNVVVPFLIGLVFSIYYWKYRNIYPLIICHFLIDMISLNAMLHR